MKYKYFTNRNVLTILSSMALCFSVYAESNSLGKAIIAGRTTAVPDSTEMLLFKMQIPSSGPGDPGRIWHSWLLGIIPVHTGVS